MIMHLQSVPLPTRASTKDPRINYPRYFLAALHSARGRADYQSGRTDAPAIPTKSRCDIACISLLARRVSRLVRVFRGIISQVGSLVSGPLRAIRGRHQIKTAHQKLLSPIVGQSHERLITSLTSLARRVEGETCLYRNR